MIVGQWRVGTRGNDLWPMGKGDGKLRVGRDASFDKAAWGREGMQACNF